MAKKHNRRYWHTNSDIGYQTETHTKRRVNRLGNPGYIYTERATTTQRQNAADFELSADWNGLSALLIARCAKSRSGVATLLGGLVQCKRRNERVLTETTTEEPMRDGYELAAPKTLEAV